MSQDSVAQIDSSAVEPEDILTAPSAASTEAVAAALPPEPLGLREVFALPAMRRMFYAQVVSVFGDFLALFAVISVMTFRLHATPQQVTGLQIAYLLPIAVLGILSGVFVDRWPLKPTMVTSDLLRGGLCLLLLVVHSTWGFYAVLASISVISSFFSPAQGVAVRSIVPLHGLRSANALLQQAFFIMRIVGPSTAAFLVASLGPHSCYLFDAVSFALSASFIGSIALKKSAEKPPATETEGAQSAGLKKVFTDMRAGTSFIVHHAALLFVIVALGAGMFVMGCFGPLIAVYVRDTLHASTRTFGVASAMIGIGLLLGVNLLNVLAKRTRESTLVYLGLGGIAMGTLVMALVAHVSFGAAGLLSGGLRGGWDYCAVADDDSAGDAAGADGARGIDGDVGDLCRTGRRIGAFRRAGGVYQRAPCVRAVHGHAGGADRRGQGVDGAEGERSGDGIGPETAKVDDQTSLHAGDVEPAPAVVDVNGGAFGQANAGGKPVG